MRFSVLSCNVKPNSKEHAMESPLHQTVAQLAYYFYVLRGCREGRDLNNWIEAERRLTNSLLLDQV
jgi:hypothetical protein